MSEDSPLDARAWDYLAAHRLAHLTTADEAGVPSVVPICYASDGHAIYSALDEKPKSAAPTALRRVRNLRARPEVALVADDYAEDWSRLAYLLVRGRADLLEPGAPEHTSAVALLRAKYPQYRSMALEERLIIRIRPTRAHLWAANPATGVPGSGSADQSCG